MKKLFLGLALVFGLVATAAAQNINVGGTAAFTLNTWKGDDADNAWKYIGEKDGAPWGAGFKAGVAFKLPLNEKAAVTAEADIALRRLAGEYVTTTTWDLEFPVLARYNVVPNFFVQGGVLFSFNLDADMDVDMGGYYDDWDDDYDDWEDDDWGDWYASDPFGSSSFDASDYTSTFNFALIFGAGYSILPNLDVDFRFTLGLTDLLDIDEGLGSSISIDAQHMNLAWGLTYWFM